ncbi:MAG: hypothetical protein IJJ14_01365 [Coriobacteriales bacterium]|nr:hypothetical protein [Coriobacteriales bacterium]MBQ6585233.1 hypothetical protein [Coriobacteriales bacterium]
MSEMDDLLALQEVDLVILRASKRLEGLPQREAILANRKKQAEVDAKAAQVKALKDQCEAKLEDLQTRDAQLAAKIDETQALINEADDFRTVDDLTEDLVRAVKAREKVDFELTSQLELMDRIEGTSRQVEQASQQLKAKELELANSFKQEVLDLRAKVAQAQESRKQLLERISPDLLRRYESVKTSKGGIAVAVNLGDRCSVCNVTFQEGQRINLQRGPAIATCPSCGRLLLRRDGKLG